MESCLIPNSNRLILPPNPLLRLMLLTIQWTVSRILSTRTKLGSTKNEQQGTEAGGPVLVQVPEEQMTVEERRAASWRGAEKNPRHLKKTRDNSRHRRRRL
ncbi:unnamed protein product [Brassica oleracea var. botrytis]|uniref:(rape) hypothetical protein n=1 Tax=Brassica napus TaxID=3708 RepID=A0A078I1B9_BRANA|nr:unnamed protein product [Brassica napus]CDY42883.1 BnaC08g46870D [Brassica napus]